MFIFMRRFVMYVGLAYYEKSKEWFIVPTQGYTSIKYTNNNAKNSISP